MLHNVKAYLTIDDSPSQNMDVMTEHLFVRSIPAIFFCRGDRLEENPDAAIRAIQKGFVLANHSYTHQRSSQKDVAFTIDEIARTERLLEKLHKQAGVAQRGRYFRFPHVDRGTAGWIVDYDAYEGDARAGVLAAFAEGLNVASMEKPDQAALDKKAALQDYLAAEGYSQPFAGVTHPWFAEGEVAAAKDCLYTFSNCDWMLTERHRGKWPYKTLDDLNGKALSDPWLSQPDSVNVILAHDQAEIVDITLKLLDKLRLNGLEFLEV